MYETQNNNLSELFTEYLQEATYLKRLRKATIRSYEDVFKNFKNHLPEVQNTFDLNPQLVMRFFREHGEKESRTSTVYTYYNKLMIFFRWLETYGHIEKGSLTRNIMAPPRPVYTDSKALSTSDISRIQSAITKSRMNDSFLLKRDLLIINLLLYTGIRKGELLGLRLQDIDWSNRYLHINSETSKSKRARNIPLNATLFMHLKNYVEELKQKKVTNEYLILSRRFTKFTEHGMKYWVKFYKENSGVSFHIHQFRHTFACTLAKKSADISSIKALMGHSSIAMTERYLRSITSLSARCYVDELVF